MKGNESRAYTNEELFIAGDMETLYLRNKDFIFYIANKFSNLKLEEDDFLCCGDMAFAKAVKTYNPEKSKWIAFFYRLMINEILMENRIRKKQINTISLEEEIKIDKYDNLKLEDVLCSSENTVDEAMNMIYIKKVSKKMKMMPEKKLRIMELYFKGCTHREIGNELSLSKSYVGKVVRDTMGILKAYYKREVQ